MAFFSSGLYLIKTNSCPLNAKIIHKHSCLCPSLFQIFHYDHPNTDVLHKNFSNRLEWRGTPDSDVQTATIYIHNITFDDIGTYRCTIHRTLHLPLYDEQVIVEKQVELKVVAVGKSGFMCTYFSTKLFWKGFSLSRKKRYMMGRLFFKNVATFLISLQPTQSSQQ